MVQFIPIIIFVGGLVTGFVVDYSFFTYKQAALLEKMYEQSVELEKEICDYNDNLVWFEDIENEELFGEENRMRKEEFQKNLELAKKKHSTSNKKV